MASNASVLTKIPPTKKPPATMTKIIEDNLQAFHVDPDFVASKKKLNREELEAELNTIKQHASFYFNFHFNRERLQTIKARRGELAPQVERRLADQGRIAVTALKDLVAAAQKIDQGLQSSGIAKAVDRHMAKLCLHLDHSAQWPGVVDQFKEMGVPESAIVCAQHQLAPVDYNPLRFGGNKNSFSDLISEATKHVPMFAKSIDTLAQHGLPTMEGSAPGSTGGAIFTVALVVGVIIVVLLAIFA